MNKRGQIAIWVIIALILVVSIILFLLIERKTSSPTEVIVKEVNPKQYIDQCVRNYVKEAVDIMLPHGGFVEPGHSKLYNNINVSYLCYNKGNYLPCINQHPMLMGKIQSEIKSYIEPRVGMCFEDLKRELEKRKSSVSLGEMTIDVSLAPGKVYVYVDREFVVSKNAVSSRFEKFDVEMFNPVYDLSNVAIKIANDEAKYCYFEYVGYMILYPEFKITKFPMSDSSIIYSITDKKSGDEMNIAIRGCAIPPGI